MRAGPRGPYAAAMLLVPIPGSWAAIATLLLLATTAAAPVAIAAPATPRAGTAEVRALRARTAELLQRREQARLEGGVSLESLEADLTRLAAELEAAGLDSLAGSVWYHDSSIRSRLSRGADAEQAMSRAIGAALRARDLSGELRYRVFLAELRVNRDPSLSLQTVRAVMPRLRGPDLQVTLGDARSTEAHAYMEMGRWSEALASARRSADVYQRADKPRERARSLLQASQCLRFLNRHAEALPIADSVIALGRRTPLGTVHARAYQERASILGTLQRPEEGLAAAREALSINRRLGDRRAANTSRLFMTNQLFTLQHHADCLLETDTLLADPNIRETPTLRIRTQLLRAGALQALRRYAEADTLLEHELARFERWRATLDTEEDRAAVVEHGLAAYGLWARVLIERGRPKDAWRASERGRAATLESRLGARDVPDADALIARLDRGHAALVQFDGVGGVGANVFVLGGGTLRAVPIPSGMRIREVELLVESMADQRGRTPPAALAKLSQVLLAEWWPQLPRGIERLVVVPPWSADALPIESLPIPGDPRGTRVGQRYAVSYVPSAGILAALDERRPEGRQLTIVADPAVDAKQPAVSSLEPATRGAVTRGLPGAREEARRLAEPGATVLVGRDATLARLRQAGPSGVLHFATHAVEDPRSASRGGLVLAGADPLLTPDEIEKLGIGADLVTLSGCGTMGSTRYAGEGSFGLARGFLVGGARSVVTTRWKVGDRAASRMMQLFYAGLRTGLPRDVCLARASEQLAREGFAARDCTAFLLIGVPDAPVERWSAGAAGRSPGAGK